MSAAIGAFLYVMLISIAWIMTFYTLNFHYLSFQLLRNSRHKKRNHKEDKLSDNASLPAVTVQLPLYNEKYVVARLIDAVCQLDFPIKKLQIQILDDSDDEPSEIIRAMVNDYELKGFDITHIHRFD